MKAHEVPITTRSFVRLYEDVLSPENCDFIIDAAERYGNFVASRVGTGIGDEYGVKPDSRVSDSLFVFNEMNGEHAQIWTTVDVMLFNATHRVMIEYIKLVGRFGGSLSDTGYQIQRIPAGTGFYDWHIDHEQSGEPERLFTIVFYLNDVAEGGETEFRHLKYGDDLVKIPPKKGYAMVMPCGWEHEHRGCMPMSNDKWIITTFVTPNQNGISYD